MNQTALQRALQLGECNFNFTLNKVKQAGGLATRRLLRMLLISLLSLTTASAHAEDGNVRAMLNSSNLLDYLKGVVPSALPRIVNNIDNGTVQRIAPEFPVWVVNSDTGELVYYQGQLSFVGQPAAKLVDDKGFRFGQRAVEMGATSRAGWVSLSLDGVNYRAYCASRSPFVACTLKL